MPQPGGLYLRQKIFNLMNASHVSKIGRSLIGAVLVAALNYIAYIGFGDSFEPWALEVWFNVRGPLPAPSEVVLISMDEDSYEELGVSMNKIWPRTIHAELLERLREAGAKRVAFDVLFAGASDDPEGDDELAEAFAGIPSIIGIQMDNPTGTIPGQSNQLIFPYEPFTKTANLALVGLPQEEDMILRFKTSRDPVTEGNLTLAEAAAGNLVVKPEKQDLIWYYGPPESDSIKVVPYYAALDPEIEPDETFRDKVIFVGLWMHTGLGPTQKDTFASPFWRRSNRQGGFAFERSRVFGVEVHATAAANLINQEWIRRADFGTEIFWLCLVVLSIAFVVSLLGPLYGCMSLVFLFVIWGFVAYELFLRRFFLPGVVSVIVLAVHYIFILVIYYLSSYRSQKNAIRALSMYVSPIVARKAVQNPKVLELGGKLTHATALFTDIADFTSISETMSAEAVSRMLNEYFTSVMEVVQKNSGTLNKFIGDAIFAIWGAPLEMEDHADKAVHTALAIERGVREFNALKRYPVLHTRIGVHTGDMIVGNLGTKSRLDFTAIGDSVNLASRLEGINKYFGTTIMISSTAVSEISTPFPLTRMGTVAVKGKEETISVYTIFDPPLSRAVEAGWREAQMEFQCRSWENAKTVFLKIASLEPRLEVATMLYLDNIKFYKEHPPLEKWNGAIIFGAK